MSIRRLALALAAVTTLSIPPAAAQVPVDEVRWDFRAEPGQRFLVTHTKEVERYKDGASIFRGKASTEFAVEVLGRDANGYAFRWTAGHIQLDDALRALTPNAEAMARMGEGMVVEFRSDLAGHPIEIVNQEALRALMASRVDQMVSETVETARRNRVPETEVSKIAAALGMAKTMFANMTPEQLSALGLDEPRQLQLASGAAYRLGQTIVRTDTFVGPFGGAPIEVEARFTLLADGLTAERATVEWEQNLDPKSTTLGVIG